jgi:chromosome segregation protein
MLKRLELVGFKSFADRTQFDFAAGITGIVGPNGSGKSNIVDAVRWILGEQSAKSLRGGEMADVIFNGSTSRRSLGLAEVTMTFDNGNGHLATEANEVQITRRVYRSGEGEYLINQQPRRLRDIKDLFLGTGAGSDAYCIIEQGRVDVLLQASTQERRTIFEEAAGISRFKAKKIETLRKLERVDQNLQRLRDIIDEVEKQLRSVKLQAAKAQRYQEYSNRLKELRIALGLEEYRQMTERLEEEVGVLGKLRAALNERTVQVEAWESETQRLEEGLAKLEEAAHQQEASLAQARQQIAAEETTLAHEWSLSGELEADLAATRDRQADLNGRVGALAHAVAQAAAELRQAETQGDDHRRRAEAFDELLQESIRRLAELQDQVQTDKAGHLEQMRQAARLQNDAVSYQAQVDNLRRERERLQLKSEQAAGHLVSLNLELRQLSQSEEALQGRLGALRQNLVDQRQERERLRQLRDSASERVSDLRSQRSGLASRIDVLDGLERGHEGLGTGVREVLSLLLGEVLEDRGSRIEDRGSKDQGRGSKIDDGGSKAEDGGPTGSGERRDVDSPSIDPQSSILNPPPSWLDLRQNILGMVADFLTVGREYAPLIDLALGQRAQGFLVQDAERLAKSLEALEKPLSGRVSFMPLQSRHVDVTFGLVPRDAERPDALSHAERGNENGANGVDGLSYPGLIARADHVVTCQDARFGRLPSQLLGQTLIVRDLSAARSIAAQAPGYRFVTLQGELLEAEGTLTVGTYHAETGILSRKSELRGLRSQTAELDQRIVQAEREVVDYRDRIAALDGQSVRLEEEIQVLTEQAADLRTRLGQHRQRQQGLNEEVTVSRSEIGVLDRDAGLLEDAWRQAKVQADEAEQKVRALHARLEGAEQEIREGEQQRHEHQRQATAARVALAQAEERLAALGARQRQLDTDLEQRRQEQIQGEKRLASSRSRLQESQRTLLQASSALAHWYVEKEAAEHVVADLTRDRESKRLERQELAERSQAGRSEWQAQQEQAHARELVVNDMKHNRESLADRLREDYQIELEELYQRMREASRIEDRGSKIEKQGGNESSQGDEIATSFVDPQSSILNPRSSLDPLVVNEEIAELRRKLARLGSVNLDSLLELSELESRAANLQTQFDDLTSAKKSLDEIISTINQDSRRLFTETFASIRTHFQELFRKLFGGGMADILLEDENDVLESGIEIIARPPGKELRSISLLSGGEKTLAAVALLLAIFRSKPSPFCILDEVDAALDEANIGRFTTVLREFLDRSQFILITHSKKTMASADVLYGITMQESGVSKRVAVRFEDWPEDGQATAAATEPALAQSNGQE